VNEGGEDGQLKLGFRQCPITQDSVKKSLSAPREAGLPEAGDPPAFVFVRGRLPWER
jgi:hypothetical protein